MNIKKPFMYKHPNNYKHLCFSSKWLKSGSSLLRPRIIVHLTEIIIKIWSYAKFATLLKTGLILAKALIVFVNL